MPANLSRDRSELGDPRPKSREGTAFIRPYNAGQPAKEYSARSLEISPQAADRTVCRLLDNRSRRVASPCRKRRLGPGRRLAEQAASVRSDAAVDQSEDRCHKVLMNVAELFPAPGPQPRLKHTTREDIVAGATD
jgi:hypothetical protein